MIPRSSSGRIDDSGSVDGDRFMEDDGVRE